MPYLIAFVLTICLSLWVQHDAKKLRSKGVSIIPGIWSALVFFGSIPLFILYLLVRIISYGPKSKTGLPPLPKAAGWTNWLVVILIIIFIGGLYLALMAAQNIRGMHNPSTQVSNNQQVSTTSITSNYGPDREVNSDFREMNTIAQASYNGVDYSASLVRNDSSTSNGSGINKYYKVLPGEQTVSFLIADISQLGGKIFVITNPNLTAYAVFARLISDPTKYYCIDSTGEGETGVVITDFTFVCE